MSKQKFLTVPMDTDTAKLLDQFKVIFGVNKKTVVKIALNKYLKSRLKGL
jgi:hypothetical protein